MRLRTSVTAVAGAGLVMATLTGCHPRQPWHSELLSADAAGTDSGDGESAAPRLSPDGTEVAFESAASDLGPADVNGHYDVYLRDLATGAMTLVSADAAGTGGGDGDSWGPVFSPDGTEVAFVSLATDLDAAATDANERPDVYLRDLATGTTTLISVGVTGTDAGNGEAGQPAFSPDGRHIAFASDASDLGPTDTDGDRDVYLRDLATGTTTLVSVDASRTDAGGGEQPRFSPDGTRIAFSSGTGDLGPTDTNGRPDIYLRDLATSTTTLVSANADGTDSGNGAVNLFAFSPDGTAIAFDSDASDLGPTDTHASTDVYVRDLTTDTTSLVSANADGTDSGDSTSLAPSFSPSGDRIVFASRAADLGPHDTNGTFDVFVRDLAAGTTTLVSANANADGTGTDSGNGPSDTGFFTAAGDQVVFVSQASDLGAHDDNGSTDVYLRDLAGGTTTLVSARADGTASANGPSETHVPDQAGTRVVFTSGASDLGANDTNGVNDVYFATYRAADLGLGLTASPEPVAPGAQLTYALALTNDGPDTADATTVALLLPEGASYDGAVASTGACSAPTSAQPRLVTCDVGDVADGATVDVEVTADVAAAPGTTLTAVAAVRTDTVDLAAADNTAIATSTVG